MTSKVLISFGLVLVLTAEIVSCGPGPIEQPKSGWGLNSKSDTATLQLIDKGHVAYLREDMDPAATDWSEREKLFQGWRQAGKKIVGIIPYHLGLPAETDDLRTVYQAAFALESKAGSVVDVWENENEPDLGFSHDLPDQSAAFMKAVYLGLKDGSADKKPVLLPALGLPPGPWFQRASENGLLFYGDAFNFHYYSHSRDFGAALDLLQSKQVEAHASDRLPNLLPIWVTEIGLNCAPLDRPDDESARKRQADFFRETAYMASEHNLAAFMPYALHDAQAGYALEAISGQPYAALSAYLDVTGTCSLYSKLPWADQAATAPRLILQWAPDPQTMIPHKVSGTYRFLEDHRRISGELRIYSFSKSTVHGQLKLEMAGDILSQEINAASQLSSVEIGPGEMQTRRLTFSGPATGYHQAWVHAEFNDAAASASPASRLSFGLETTPRGQDFVAQPCSLILPKQTATGYAFQSIDEPYPYIVTSQADSWLGINGLKIMRSSKADGPPSFTFTLDNPSVLPGQPPMAITTVQGLPADAAFLRLTANRLWGKNVRVRVDLIDDAGQRFSIFENCGLSYSVSSSEAWLNLKDFHPYVWGRFIPNRPFQNQKIREIQLRFYFDFVHDPVQVQLDVLTLNKVQ